MNHMKKGYGPLPAVPQSRRALVLLSVGSLILLVFLWNAFSVDAPYHLRPPPTNHDDVPDAPHAPYTASKHTPRPDVKTGGDPLCAHHPDTSNIGVVMKTGATEAYARIPTQLLTVLRCVSDFRIFSDKAQTVAGIPIHDSLDEVLPEAMEGNADFDLYRDQDECEVDVGPCTAGHDRAKSGWNLDKYKNIHMAEKAYKMMPGKDWYIFVDADTYVLWNTLVEWLGKMDPSEELYLGSVAYVAKFPFSHGGSGYVLSRAAMEAVVGKNPGIGNKYDVRVKETCCGDYMFSKAAKEVADIDVRNVVSLAVLHSQHHQFRVLTQSVAHHQRREALHPPLRPHPLVPPRRHNAPPLHRRALLLLRVRDRPLRRLLGPRPDAPPHHPRRLLRPAPLPPPRGLGQPLRRPPLPKHHAGRREKEEGGARREEDDGGAARGAL